MLSDPAHIPGTLQYVTLSLAQMVGRSKNKFYVAQCLQEALGMQSTPHDGVEGTGVYVREVFNNPKLPMGMERGVHVI